MSEVTAVLKKLPVDAVVLAVGHANAVGAARHNLHLSDLRAACATYCLRQLLGNRRDGFRFRELAKGEEIDASDPTGTSSQSRRVDVKVCEGRCPPSGRRLPSGRGPQKPAAARKGQRRRPLSALWRSYGVFALATSPPPGQRVEGVGGLHAHHLRHVVREVLVVGFQAERNALVGERLRT